MRYLRLRGVRVSRSRHKHLCEYTCCEQCSKSVAADKKNADNEQLEKQ